MGVLDPAVGWPSLRAAEALVPLESQGGNTGRKMSIKVRGFAGILFLIGVAVFLISCGNSPSRPAGVLLVTSEGASSVTSYGINLDTGGLSQINTSAQTQNVPSSIVLDPSGAFAYVTNSASNTLSAYSVNPNGTLMAVSGNPATGTTPIALAIDHAGHFLFVANQGSNDVSVFSVGSSGSVTLVGSFPTGTPPTPTATSGAAPASVAVDPSGSFLYVANQGQGTISVFSVDSSGALTQILGSPFSVRTTPSGLAVATTTTTNPAPITILYVANEGSNDVSAFVICETVSPSCAIAGTPVEVSGSPFAAGLGPVSAAIDPSVNFLYVADLNSNQVSGYRINPSTGALTALSPATVSTGSRPVFVAVHPGGQYLYVANNGSDSISGFKLTAKSGELTPLAPVASASRPAGIALR